MELWNVGLMCHWHSFGRILAIVTFQNSNTLLFLRIDNVEDDINT
jgi:hypothetical protein